MLSLDSPVKVGRSVARARPIQTNAIFDCKVKIPKDLENWAVLKSLSIVVLFLVFRCFLAIMRCCGMRMASSTFRFVFLPFLHFLQHLYLVTAAKQSHQILIGMSKEVLWCDFDMMYGQLFWWAFLESLDWSLAFFIFSSKAFGKSLVPGPRIPTVGRCQRWAGSD